MLRRPFCLALLVVASATIGACQTGGTAIDALGGTQTAAQARQIQARTVEVSDDKVLIQTVVSTLQDFGFEIRESNIDAGLVSGRKVQTTIDLFRRFRDVRVTVTTTKVADNSSRVRVNFQNIVPLRGVAHYTSEPITDETIYQRFFNSLEQSLFLARNT